MKIISQSIWLALAIVVVSCTAPGNDKPAAKLSEETLSQFSKERKEVLNEQQNLYQDLLRLFTAYTEACANPELDQEIKEQVLGLSGILEPLFQMNSNLAESREDCDERLVRLVGKSSNDEEFLTGWGAIKQELSGNQQEFVRLLTEAGMQFKQFGIEVELGVSQFQMETPETSPQ